MIDDIKHWVDLICTSTVAVLMGLFAWLDFELPKITAWLTFISVLCSVIWWVYRYYGLYKGNKNGW